jgi:hypothetical protein
MEALSYTWCRECGERLVRIPYTRCFCTPACRQTHHNRRVMGGLQLYDAAMAWRLDNTRKVKGLLVELTRIADRLASDERELKARRDARIKAQKKAGLPHATFVDSPRSNAARVAPAAIKAAE